MQTSRQTLKNETQSPEPDFRLGAKCLLSHCRKVAVVDELDAVSFNVLTGLGVFHNLIFPYSSLPCTRCALEVVGFERGMKIGFGDTFGH